MLEGAKMCSTAHGNVCNALAVFHAGPGSRDQGRAARAPSIDDALVQVMLSLVHSLPLMQRGESQDQFNKRDRLSPPKPLMRRSITT